MAYVKIVYKENFSLGFVCHSWLSPLALPITPTITECFKGHPFTSLALPLNITISDSKVSVRIMLGSVISTTVSEL